MRILVLGASGATGRHVVNFLINNNHQVKAIVRTSAAIPAEWQRNERLTLIKVNISEITAEEAHLYVYDCQAVICCLGHTMNAKGIWGKPRNLVVDAVRLFCMSIINIQGAMPVKFVLMNTIGFQNKAAKENVSVAQRIALGLIELLVPPHRDNVRAALYLSRQIGSDNSNVEWVVVRPDGLTNEEQSSPYYASPVPVTTLFKPGKVSRTNVAHFMSKLATDDTLWHKWKSKMPVLYNVTDIPQDSENAGQTAATR
jgi:hypothetical protein